MRGRSLLSIERKRWVFCYAALLPVLAVFVVVRVVPIARTFALSLSESSLISLKSRFIGAQNFTDLLHDDLFLTAIGNTTLFAFATVALSVAFGMALALLMHQGFGLNPLYETVFFLPVITPMVPVAIIWKWIYDPSYGLLNYILSWFGVRPVGWLVYPNLALWAIVILSVWKVVGYNMVIFLVGLRNIPSSYYEAARIDGAAGAGLFRYITFPLIKPILLFVIVVTTINSYNVFTQVYVMTTGIQGSPGNTVRVLVYDIWENAFRYSRMGYASAEAVILFLIVLVLTLAQFRLVRSET
jgi:multiple sugar transport system permease protein